MRNMVWLSNSGLHSAVAFASLSLFSLSAAALQPLITDDTGTQGTGGNQLEVSYGLDRTRVDGETERAHSVPVVYTYGLTDAIDIYAGITYSRLRVSGPDASGFSNTVVGAKWRFYENEESGTSLAIKPEVAAPVSKQREEDGLGTGKTSGALTFILSQDVAFGSVHFNAGVGRDRFRNSEDNATTKHLSVAPVWDVSDQWKLAADFGVDWERASGNTVRSKYGEIGAIYSPSEDLDLAIGFIRTTDNDSPKSKTNSLTAGLTWRF